MIKSRWILLVSAVIFLLYLAIYGAGSTIKKEYSINKKPDGGYSLSIVLNKRFWKLITPEGVFPSVRRTCNIEITGKGEDWSYRNQDGHYYSLDQIESSQKEWDFGYAWVSNDHKYLYLNLFWVKAPNSVTPADINGKYQL